MTEETGLSSDGVSPNTNPEDKTVVVAMLFRIDPAKHMDRWYSVSVQSTLFDQWSVVCAWGSRRNAYQRRQVFPVESVEAANKMANRIVARKLKKGYVRQAVA